VRGVAMNPTDHPHGGRAKSIKYQRTPWGKTTKFK
jgi:ribosomal protein L2